MRALVSVMLLAFLVGLSGGSDEACLCLPHHCLGLELQPHAVADLLAGLRRDLDVTSDAAVGYHGHNNGSQALLLTVGGPPRAESVVQAHVVLHVVRRWHSDATTPIEVWHAGEVGVEHACAVWAVHFAPLRCYHAWQVAQSRLPGLVFGDGQGAAGPAEAPSLEWVRGWPIKPLALLLTEHDVVAMVDADSVPLVALPRLLDRTVSSVGRALTEHGAVFWPDVRRASDRLSGHNRLREGLGLPTWSSATHVWEAESGQLVVDRRRSWLPLRIAWVLNAHPVSYTLLHGDKDLYRVAFELAHQPYHQVASRPHAVGGLGAQAMVDGEAALPSHPSNFCGQALLQRQDDGEPAFLHRVLAKYNLMNLLSEASWASIAPTTDADEAQLVQRGWCIEVEGDGPNPPHKPAGELLLDLARCARQARLEMAAVF